MTNETIVGTATTPDTLPARLNKTLSQAAHDKAVELVQAMAERDDLTGEQKHEAVVNGVLEFVEKLDDKVALIPFAGPLLAVLVDTPPVNDLERKLVEYVVEAVYRTLKIA